MAVNLVGVRFGGAAMGLAAQVLLARLLPQTEVGIVLMGLSTAAIVSLLMTAGYPSLTMTILPRYFALGRTHLAAAFHRALWHDSLIVTSALALVGLAVYVWVPLPPELRTALVFGCLMAPASSLIRITSSVANSKRRFQLSYVPDFIFRPGLLLVFLGVMWALGLEPGLLTVIAVIIAITFAVAIGQAVILGRDVLPKSLKTRRHDLAPVLRGRAASMIIVAAVAMSFADIVTLIGGLFLAAEDVAELGIAIRLAALAGFVMQATQNFVLPDLSEAIVKGNAKLARSLILRINVIALIAIAGCVLGSALLGPLILSVFGADYTAAHWPLVLFMMSQLFRAAGGMNQHLLSIDGYQLRSAWACIVSLGVLVSGAFLLTPVFGVMGMALAVLATDLVWAAVLGFQAEKYAGYRGDIFAAFPFRKAAGE